MLNELQQGLKQENQLRWENFCNSKTSKELFEHESAKKQRPLTDSAFEIPKNDNDCKSQTAMSNRKYCILDYGNTEEEKKPIDLIFLQ